MLKTPATMWLRFLQLFRSPRFADVSLNQWMALTPPELVKAHLNLDDATMAKLPSCSTSSTRRSATPYTTPLLSPEAIAMRPRSVCLRCL
jgi:hypothetical protein